MASTRYQHPMIEIYQDPQTYDSAPMPTSKRSSTSKPTPPLRAALKDASSRRNIVFTPPFAEMSGRKPSPLKSSHQQLSSPLSSSPSRRPFSNKFNMVQMPPPPSSISHTDSIEKRMPEKFRNAPQKALFTTFMAEPPEDKENMNTFYPSHYNNQSTRAEFPIDMNYGQKGMNKRTLMDAAPIQGSSRPFKKPKQSSSTNQLPQPDDFPILYDDGKKPPHSYAQLIGMAILRTPNRRLTLAQIYKWISDTYSFYSPNLAGWQNSIRHNLSLNKAFVKQERPKDDPGKGNYWAIAPGTEHQFLKGKQGGKAMTVENSTILTSAPVAQPEPESQSTSKQAMPDLPAPSSFVPEPLAPAPELDSDATIPASDAFIPEEEPSMPPPSTFIASSPPPQIHSSPPVSHHSTRDDTPPPVPPFPTSSALRSHRRKVASMDDSGYFSGLSSSAMRAPNSQKNRFVSEADHTRFKSRGRAEEEIARLRGSSYDSPTKSITRPSRSVGFSHNRLDSSPVRRGNNDSSQMLPPLTPAVKFKAPERPPPSISPNANLRLHRQSVRELIGSPLRGITVLEDKLPWSPEFNLDAANYIFNDGDLGFDIYADASNDDFNPHAIQANALNGSPEKKEYRKHRSLTDSGRSKSSGALGDITNTSRLSSSNLFAGARNANGTPLLKNTPQLSPHPNFVGNENAISPSKSYGFSNSPSKLPAGLSSPSKMFSSHSPSKSLFSNPLMDMGYASGGFDLALTGDDWAGDDFLVNDFSNAGGNVTNNSTNTLPDQENMDPSPNNGAGFEGGLDLLGGFQRIGSGAGSRNGATSASAAVTSFGASLGNVAKGGRPSMGRSFTSRF